jgi:hypothetical protein
VLEGETVGIDGTTSSMPTPKGPSDDGQLLARQQCLQNTEAYLADRAEQFTLFDVRRALVKTGEETNRFPIGWWRLKCPGVRLSSRDKDCKVPPNLCFLGLRSG